MQHSVVIGLEVHVELLTRTKLFCRCSTKFGAPPNSQVCPVCLGLPGALPVLNKEAVDQALRAALALGCRINSTSMFARKHYFYPDLPKGYQITQHSQPLAQAGRVDIGTTQVAIARLHIEEDAGRSVHTPKSTLVDYNRSGIPLAEIVTEPCLTSPAQAREFLEVLKSLLEYTGVSDCKMEEGSLRCDANISLQGQAAGARTEIKNLNSFRAVEKALAYEVRRQGQLLEQGEEVLPQTLRWDEAGDQTVAMRTKEQASDYLYLTEPDLPPLILDEAAIQRAANLPELPLARKARWIEEYNLPSADADILIRNRTLASWFDRMMAAGAEPHLAANWLLGEVSRLLKEAKQDDPPFSPADLVRLIELNQRGGISGASAKDVLARMFESGRTPEEIVQRLDLGQISARDELEELARQVVASNPDAVQDFQSGKERALKFLLGQGMKLSLGKANPQILRDMMLKVLNIPDNH